MSLDPDAIEARATAATEGPWAVEQDDGEAHVYLDDAGNGTAYICREVAQGDDCGLADAEFIARAREDVPALVDALRRARDRAVALEQENAKLVEQRNAALALHERGAGPTRPLCLRCFAAWPCPTARALGTGER
jgi:hypothetical protein